ncbi:hypothetical protein D3C81_1947500 [compost metagenome]
MPAVRGGPQDAHGLAACGLQRIDLIDIADVVPGLAVVGPVHGDGDGIVVDGHIWVAIGPGATAAGSACPCEQVYIQFALEGESLLLGTSHVDLLGGCHAAAPAFAALAGVSRS